jgi:hypothetical protein
MAPVSIVWALLVLLLPLAFAAGILLIALGIRGRLVDDHPHCRRCRFDLSGINVTKCPECGADLRGGAGVRRGLRRARWGMVAAGVLLIMPSLAIWGWRLAPTSAQITAWKPSWLLRAELSSSDSATADAAGRELGVRIRSGLLNAEATSAIVDEVLRIHADENLGWSAAVSTPLLEAWNARSVSPAQFERYVRQMLRFELRVRSILDAAGTIPVRVAIPTPRRVSGIDAELSYEHEYLIDGAVFARPGRFTTGTSLDGLAGEGWSDSELSVELPLGKHTLGLRTKLRVGQIGSGVMDERVKADLELLLEAEPREITIVPAGTPLVELVDPEQHGDRVRAAISVPKVQVETYEVSGMDPFLSVSVRVEPLTVAVAFDVLVVLDGEEVKVSTVSRRAFTNPLQSGMGFSTKRLPTGPTAKVILRASQAAARRDPEVAGIWGGELVFENVPVERVKR